MPLNLTLNRADRIKIGENIYISIGEKESLSAVDRVVLNIEAPREIEIRRCKGANREFWDRKEEKENNHSEEFSSRLNDEGFDGGC